MKLRVQLKGIAEMMDNVEEVVMVTGKTPHLKVDFTDISGKKLTAIYPTGEIVRFIITEKEEA